MFYLEQVLEGVVVLVQPCVPDSHDEVKKGLETSLINIRQSEFVLIEVTNQKPVQCVGHMDQSEASVTCWPGEPSCTLRTW